MDFEIGAAVTVAVVGADRRQPILDSGAWECMAHASRWALRCAELIQHAQLRRLVPTVRCAALRPPTPTRFSLAVVPTSEAVLTRYSLCDRRAPATACAAPLGAFGFSVVRSLLRELTLRLV